MFLIDAINYFHNPMTHTCTTKKKSIATVQALFDKLTIIQLTPSNCYTLTQKKKMLFGKIHLFAFRDSDSQNMVQSNGYKNVYIHKQQRLLLQRQNSELNKIFDTLLHFDRLYLNVKWCIQKLRRMKLINVLITRNLLN